VKDEKARANNPPLIRLPSRSLDHLRPSVGVILLLCGVVYLFGLTTEVAWMLNVRTQGERAEARITAYQQDHPVVRFGTYLKEPVEVTLRQQFSSWSRPAPGTIVDVFYVPTDPRDCHIVIRSGLARYEWLLVPGLLAFLFLCMLRIGLSLLLFFDSTRNPA
jgi:hypothetical protein